MKRKILEQELIQDEGKKLIVYRDSLNILTVGIGHRILIEDGLYLGDTINEERCQNLFNIDLNNAIKTCQHLFINQEMFKENTEIVQDKIKTVQNSDDELSHILINMAFNLGQSKFSLFKRFIKAINKKDFVKAANEMIFSKWYAQVGDRARRLEERIRRL